MTVSSDSVSPTEAMASGPSLETQKMSATAKTLSSTTSSTIGTASKSTARPIGPTVKSWCTSPRTDSRTMVQKLTASAPDVVSGSGGGVSSSSAGWVTGGLEARTRQDRVLPESG